MYRHCVRKVLVLDTHATEEPFCLVIIHSYHRRPTTIIYDRGINLAKNVTAEDGSIAIRVSSDRFCRQLCRALRRPLVSTSANISGQASPATFKKISPEIINAVDYVVEHRRNDSTIASPSIIIKISNDSTFKIIRK